MFGGVESEAESEVCDLLMRGKNAFLPCFYSTLAELNVCLCSCERNSTRLWECVNNLCIIIAHVFILDDDAYDGRDGNQCLYYKHICT